MELSVNLRVARTRIGKSQLQVAKDIGISNAALSNYETGYREPDLDTLSKLADYYGVTLDALVGRELIAEDPVVDIGSIAKQKIIAFKGEKYQLKDSQKRTLIKELGEFFYRFDRSKIQE
ncbi:MAG: helix-turn-helix transcriptional regulator [Veillonella sp.]|nr:helix-turn-helix transcriptional regulator [Veillonella sp.]MCF0156710.1 helix-turn-helix transcriptional regulator [Veillonella sp.]